MDLSHFRKKIDTADHKILEGLKERFDVVQEVAQFKKNEKVKIGDPGREKDLIHDRQSLARDLGVPEGIILPLWNIILDASRITQALEIGENVLPDERLENLQHWSLIIEGGNEKLFKRYRFQDFKSAYDFVSKIAEISEKENHHPDIELRWGEVTVTWWSHKKGGITEKDIELAAQTDTLLRRSSE